MRVVVGWGAICIKIKTIDNKQRLSTSATTQVNEGGQICHVSKVVPTICHVFKVVRPGDTPRELTKASVLLLLALLLTLLLLLGACTGARVKALDVRGDKGGCGLACVLACGLA